MNPFILLVLVLFLFVFYFISVNEEISFNLGKYRFNVREEKINNFTLGVKVLSDPKNMGLYIAKRKYVFWFECL